MAAPTTVKGNRTLATSNNVLSVPASGGALTVVWLYARAPTRQAGEVGPTGIEWRVSCNCTMRDPVNPVAFDDATATDFALRASGADPKRPHELILRRLGAQTSIIAVAWLPTQPEIGAVQFTFRAIGKDGVDDPDAILDVWGFPDSIAHENCGFYLCPFSP